MNVFKTTLFSNGTRNEQIGLALQSVTLTGCMCVL